MENEVSTHPKVRITPQEYLELERKAEIKSEYADGEMFAMSGATREHTLIVTNITVELGNQFIDRACELYPLDLRAKVVNRALHISRHLSSVWRAEI